MSIARSFLPSIRCIAGPSRAPPALRIPLPAATSTMTATFRSAHSFSRPGPPPLPAADQAEFDALVKKNEAVGATPEITKPAEEIEHRDIRRGARAEFDGDVNPRTGERGGPKVDPFKAGDGDWQYGGRVTDF